MSGPRLGQPFELNIGLAAPIIRARTRSGGVAVLKRDPDGALEARHLLEALGLLDTARALAHRREDGYR